MDKDAFVSHLVAEICDGSAAGLLAHRENPVGRGVKPAQRELADWIRTRSEEDRARILFLMDDMLRHTVFGMLLMFDDADIYRDGEVAGTLRLEYRETDATSHLNEPKGEMLHDIFNALMPAKPG